MICNICQQHQHAKWHDHSHGQIINPIALLEFIDTLGDGTSKQRVMGWVMHVAGIQWPIPAAPPQDGTR